jgi:hypothetical protein
VLLLVEIALGIAAVWLASHRPALGSQAFSKFELLLSRFAQRKNLTVLMIGMLTLGLRLAVLPAEPIPHPAIHDEFTYLLQADTFAHGRLTNPTPPMWEHYETFYVIFQPSYCGKYFPGQGLFLALGQVVFGHPFWGVWLTSGLMCAAITWMLQGWFSPGWALLGGFIAMLRLGVFGYWADSYWGGNVAAIGGALVLGALPRIKSSHRMRDGLFMGLGMALLANSRPWEGLILSIPVAVILMRWMMGPNRPSFRVLLRRIVLPLAAILALCAGWLGYYNRVTTGNPLRTPFQVYEQTYGAVPNMIWQRIKPEPVYRHAVFSKLRVEYELEAKSHKVLAGQIAKIASAIIFFLGPVLLLPFAVLLSAPYKFAWRHPGCNGRTLLTILIVSCVGAGFSVFYSPHYSAPVTGLIIALVLLAMRRLRRLNQSGVFLVRAIPMICLIVFALRVLAAPLNISVGQIHTYGWYQFPLGYPKGRALRARIERELYTIPADHLVIVRYSSEHDVHLEWVYNDADIDHAKIVWAREMTAGEDQQLIKYFNKRKVWLLEPDVVPPRLSVYGGT